MFTWAFSNPHFNKSTVSISLLDLISSNHRSWLIPTVLNQVNLHDFFLVMPFSSLFSTQFRYLHFDYPLKSAEPSESLLRLSFNLEPTHSLTSRVSLTLPLVVLQISAFAFSFYLIVGVFIWPICFVINGCKGQEQVALGLLKDEIYQTKLNLIQSTERSKVLSASIALALKLREFTIIERIQLYLRKPLFCLKKNNLKYLHLLERK